VFENRVLGVLLGCNKDEIMGSWRNLHNELHLYSSPNIITIIRCRRIRLIVHVAGMEENRPQTGFRWENQ
jgi:hypothetical protein